MDTLGWTMVVCCLVLYDVQVHALRIVDKTYTTSTTLTIDGSSAEQQSLEIINCVFEKEATIKFLSTDGEEGTPLTALVANSRFDAHVALFLNIGSGSSITLRNSTIVSGGLTLEGTMTDATLTMDTLAIQPLLEILKGRFERSTVSLQDTTIINEVLGGTGAATQALRTADGLVAEFINTSIILQDCRITSADSHAVRFVPTVFTNGVLQLSNNQLISRDATSGVSVFLSSGRLIIDRFNTIQGAVQLQVLSPLASSVATSGPSKIALWNNHRLVNFKLQGLCSHSSVELQNITLSEELDISVGSFRLRQHSNMTIRMHSVLLGKHAILDLKESTHSNITMVNTTMPPSELSAEPRLKIEAPQSAVLHGMAVVISESTVNGSMEVDAAFNASTFTVESSSCTQFMVTRTKFSNSVVHLSKSRFDNPSRHTAGEGRSIAFVHHDSTVAADNDNTRIVIEHNTIHSPQSVGMSIVVTHFNEGMILLRGNVVSGGIKALDLALSSGGGVVIDDTSIFKGAVEVEFSVEAHASEPSRIDFRNNDGITKLAVTRLPSHSSLKIINSAISEVLRVSCAVTSALTNLTIETTTIGSASTAVNHRIDLRGSTSAHLTVHNSSITTTLNVELLGALTDSLIDVSNTVIYCHVLDFTGVIMTDSSFLLTESVVNAQVLVDPRFERSRFILKDNTVFNENEALQGSHTTVRFLHGPSVNSTLILDGNRLTSVNYYALRCNVECVQSTVHLLGNILKAKTYGIYVRLTVGGFVHMDALNVVVATKVLFFVARTDDNDDDSRQDAVHLHNSHGLETVSIKLPDRSAVTLRNTSISTGLFVDGVGSNNSRSSVSILDNVLLGGTAFFSGKEMRLTMVESAALKDDTTLTVNHCHIPQVLAVIGHTTTLGKNIAIPSLKLQYVRFLPRSTFAVRGVTVKTTSFTDTSWLLSTIRLHDIVLESTFSLNDARSSQVCISGARFVTIALKDNEELLLSIQNSTSSKGLTHGVHSLPNSTIYIANSTLPELKLRVSQNSTIFIGEDVVSSNLEVTSKDDSSILYLESTDTTASDSVVSVSSDVPVVRGGFDKDAWRRAMYRVCEHVVPEPPTLSHTRTYVEQHTRSASFSVTALAPRSTPSMSRSATTSITTTLDKSPQVTSVSSTAPVVPPPPPTPTTLPPSTVQPEPPTESPPDTSSPTSAAPPTKPPTKVTVSSLFTTDEDVNQAVEGSTVSAVVASAALTPTAASQLSRVAASTQAINCFVGDDDNERPSYFELPIQPAVGNGRFKHHVGGVVCATAIILASFGVLLGLRHVAQTRFATEQLRTSPSTNHHLPSTGQVPSTALERCLVIQGTVASVFLLYLAPNIVGAAVTVIIHGAAVEVVVAAISLLLLLLLIFRLFWWFLKQFAVSQQRTGGDCGSSSTTTTTSSSSTSTSTTELDTSWSDSDGDEHSDSDDTRTVSTKDARKRKKPLKVTFTDFPTGSYFTMTFQALFDGAADVESAWKRLYALEELWASVIIAGIAGVLPGEAHCSKVTSAILFVGLLHLLYVVRWMPLRTGQDRFFSLFFAIVQVVMGVTCVVATILTERDGIDSAQRETAMKVVSATVMITFLGFFVQVIAQSYWAYYRFARRQSLEATRDDQANVDKVETGTKHRRRLSVISSEDGSTNNSMEDFSDTELLAVPFLNGDESGDAGVPTDVGDPPTSNAGGLTGVTNTHRHLNPLQ